MGSTVVQTLSTLPETHILKLRIRTKKAQKYILKKKIPRKTENRAVGEKHQVSQDEGRIDSEPNYRLIGCIHNVRSGGGAPGQRISCRLPKFALVHSQDIIIQSHNLSNNESVISSCRHSVNCRLRRSGAPSHTKRR